MLSKFYFGRLQWDARCSPRDRRGKACKRLLNATVLEVAVVISQHHAAPSTICKEVIIYLPPACIYQCQQLGIDPTFPLAPALMEIINSGSFWDTVERAVHANDAI